MKYLPRPKRSKLEIYNEILSAINEELTDCEERHTRVQSNCNLAYDKLAKYLDELESKKMIMQNPLGITERGRDFLQDYDRINDFVSAMSLKYIDTPGRGEIYER